MNETQIIQNQIATERLHSAEVAQACSAALGRGSWASQGEFATACADYFKFAVARLASKPDVPAAEASVERWREFLKRFTEESAKYFALVDSKLTCNVPVTEWRAASKIDADSIFAERTLYARVKAAIA